MTHTNRIIIALDFPTASQAMTLVNQLSPSECRLKIGKELFTAAGPELIKTLHSRGFEVFLDLKFHDIPSTVGKAVKAAADLGVWMVNVHALGGTQMMRAAREAIEHHSTPPYLIAVTVLTSMNDNQWQTIGQSDSAAEGAQRLARLAHQADLDGVVCSANEAALIKSITDPNFLTVTPGIRLPEDDVGDQSRIATPQFAFDNGADYLVMGRSISQSTDPLRTLQLINSSKL